jgi:hypothetical protein
MSRKSIEALLTIEWCSHLSTPVFVVEPNGALLFYNEPAEVLLGTHFEDTGPLEQGQWATKWDPTDVNGDHLHPGDLPLVKTLTSGEPSQGDLWIVASDGVRRHLAVTAIPIVGTHGVTFGAAAIFWEEA